MNSFETLKERWKVSIGAMIKRWAKLGMLSEEYQRRLWKNYSTRGWRKSEPLDDELELEHPRLLSRSVRLLVEEKVCDRKTLLDEFRLHGPDVEALCGLPRGYMTKEPAVATRLVRLKSLGTNEVGGTVVPFGRKRT